VLVLVLVLVLVFSPGKISIYLPFCPWFLSRLLRPLGRVCDTDTEPERACTGAKKRLGRASVCSLFAEGEKGGRAGGLKLKPAQAGACLGVELEWEHVDIENESAGLCGTPRPVTSKKPARLIRGHARA